MIKNKKNKTNSKEPPAPIRKEIRGIIFLLIAIIMGVGLFSYHPADPLFWDKTDFIGKAHNLFGIVGAHLAGGIFRLFGFSSFWLVVIFFTLTILSFREHTISSPVRNIITGLILII